MNDKDICRLCLTTCSISTNIFIEDWVNKIKDSLNVEICDKDDFPNLICDICTHKIEEIHKYRNVVLQNQKVLENSCLMPTEEDSLDEVKYLVELEADTPDDQDENSQSQEFINLDELDTILDDDDDEDGVDNNIKNETDIILSIEEVSDMETVKDEDEEATIEIDPIPNPEKINVLPELLTKRMTKNKSDQQIREFVLLCCDLCNNKEQFDTFKELLEHFKNIHQVPGYVICCNKKITRKDRLLNHITNHINPDAFKCPVCGQVSKSKILLKIHMKQHLPIDERPFECKTCNQKFVLKSQLTNHEATHYSPDQKKYVCDECGKAFALNFVLIKHKLTHRKEKNFVCEHCAKSFSTKANLETHSAHHLDRTEQRMQCNCCGQWYKNLETLRTHARKHRDSTKYICNTCGKSTTTKSALSAHIKYVHLKTKEFECSVCNKQFRRKLELTEHTARHTNQILYSCPFCPKTFKSSSNYFSHRKNSHPDEFAIIANKSKESIEFDV